HLLTMTDTALRYTCRVKINNKNSAIHAEAGLSGEAASICSIVQRLDSVCYFSAEESTEEALGCEISFWMK
ncbi:hypothetical protein, partial [Microvirga aerilata]